MSFTETVAAGRAFAKNDEPSLRANRELLATGSANVGGAFFGAMPGGGGTSQTAVNRLPGARTQLSELVPAGLTLMTMLLLAPLIGLMPQATLAAVVIVYSLGLIKPKEFREILGIRQLATAGTPDDERLFTVGAGNRRRQRHRARSQLNRFCFGVKNSCLLRQCPNLAARREDEVLLVGSPPAAALGVGRFGPTWQQAMQARAINQTGVRVVIAGRETR